MGSTDAIINPSAPSRVSPAVIPAGVSIEFSGNGGRFMRIHYRLWLGFYQHFWQTFARGLSLFTSFGAPSVRASGFDHPRRLFFFVLF
jgi:hypothetical protein